MMRVQIYGGGGGQQRTMSEAEAVTQLVEMGFGREDATAAIRR